MDDLVKLFKKAKAGDSKAFEALIINYEKLIFNITYKYFLNIEDAKDISQEILIKIYKNISKCQDYTTFKAWISKIAANACLDELRKRKNIQLEEIDSKKDISDTEPSPEIRLTQKETAEEILAALDKLPNDAKTLIILRDINGLSYNELTQHTNLNQGTIKSRLSRARAGLKKLLEPK